MSGWRWIALTVLLSGSLLPARAGAQPALTALAPIETVLDGRTELVGVAVAPDGTRYVSDRGAGSVWRITASGIVPIAASGLARPAGLALDADGRLLIAEEQAGRLLRLEPTNTLTVLATGIKTPRWLVVNPDGSLYVSAHGLTAPDGLDPSEGREILRFVPGQGLSVVATGIRRLEGILRLNGGLVAATKGLESGPESAGMLLRFPVNPDGSLGAPVSWVGTGLKQPRGLLLDPLAAVFVSTKEVTGEIDTAKRAIGKVHPDLHLTDFAANLSDPQGLALGPEGALYLADGNAGRLLRFLAPAAPALTSSVFTRLSPFTVTGTTAPGARVDLFLNDAVPAAATVTADGGGAFSAALTLTLNAPNPLEVFATTHGGDGLTSPPAQVTVTHDDVAPTLAFDAPPPGAHVRGLVPVQAQATDLGSEVASLALTVDGQSLPATLTPTPPAASVTAAASWTTTAVLDGTHTLGASASDQAGNPATASRVVIVDNTPPDTFITGAPAADVNTPTLTLSFSGADNLTPVASLQFAWRLDAGPFSPFSAATTATLTNLTEGQHTFEVKARDLAGNEDPTPAAVIFTVRFGPSITSVDPASGPIGTFVTLTGTNFEPGATQVTFNGLAAAVRTVTAAQITTTVPIGATTGPLTVTTSRGSASVTFTVTATGDFTLTAAPASVRAIAGDQTSVNIAAGGTGSFTSLVSLTVSTPPTGITASFSPSQFVAPGASAFVNLAPGSTVAPGAYNFTVTGQAQVDGRTLTRMTAFTLEVLAPNTTAITGRVLTAEAVPQPIPGVTVTLGSAFTLTDAGGNFVLLAPPAGANMLLVDGRTASTPTVQYPPVEVNIAVNASGPTRVPFIVYLPKLDTANPVTLPLNAGGFTTQEVKASTPMIPGLVVTIPTGTRIIGPDGTPVSQITITPVPVDRTPMPFPPGVSPPFLFTIQPGGAVPSQPLPISFPNVQQAPPGSVADLWFFDLAAGNWAIWGTGTVSADGTQIVSDPGFGLPRFAWHTTNNRSVSEAVRERHAKACEPVDLVTGRFVVSKTDLVLPGRLPISIQRHYGSGTAQIGLFGRGWNLDVYDRRINQTAGVVSLLIPDQSAYSFVQSSPGQWTNATEPFLRGAVLTALPGDFRWQLRLKDGTVQRFERLLGFANEAALAAITDRNGNTVSITRVAVPFQNHLITQITEPAGRSFTLAYDTAGRITSVTDPIGRVVQYTYDALGRLETVTDPAGGVTRYTHDASDRLVSITDPRNITFVTNEYDANGRVVRQTQGDGGVWHVAYSVTGALVNQTAVTDPRGNVTTYRFNAQGFTTSVTDALGQTTVNEYAPGSGLLIATTDPLGRTTRFTYDTQGNVTSVTDPAENSRTFTYEPIFNKIASITNPLGQVTSFAYDAQGNLASITNPLGKITTLAYNSFGHPVTTTDPLGNTTTFTYDALGNLAAVADPLGNTTTRQYDAVSRLARRTDPRGKPTMFAYDPLNRLTVISDSLGGATRFAYDGNGNVLTVADPQGHMTAYSYDAMDRVATRSDPLGQSESFTYDPAGNLTRLTDRKGQAATFGYDALNRRTAATYVDATVTSTYDAVGRLTQATDSAGGTITNAYDSLDRLMSQATALGEVGYTYDTLGRRTTMTVPGQTPISYSYNGASRVTAITQGSSLVQFAYDAANRRTTLTMPNGVTTQYGYDLASRLTSLTYTLGATALGDLQYAYDAAGNRTRVAGSWARTGLPQPLAATYNANNQQLTFGGQPLTYDLNGNLTSDGTSTYTWTARNQLAMISGPMPASFVYDGAGRRMRKTINGTITDVLYDGLNAIQEVSSATAAGLLTGLGIDEYFVRSDTSGVSVLLSDALGSTVALTDPAGAVQTQHTYEPFGATSTTGAASANPFQYTGRENDGTGLYYYRARYYHPGLQRFVSQDPFTVLGGDVNYYLYAANNPTNLGDPTGLLLERIWSNPQQRAAYSTNAITLDQFIQATQNKSLVEIQHAVDQGMARDSSAGGPDPAIRWVINPNNPAEVIDMRHFLVVGPKGETFGLLVELAQLLAGNKSAFDAQDFLSNYLGSEFFRTYNANRALGDQLKQFFRSRKRK